MKIKSIICAIAISSITVFASSSATLDGQSSIISEMDNIAKMSPEKGNIFKAMLYEYGYEAENIKPDIQKAKEFYELAYVERSPIAAFKLAMYAWSEEREKGISIGKPLEYFAKGMSFEPKEQALLNRIASGIYLYNHQEYRTTIDVLISAAREHNATAQLYVALSYLELGDIAQANTFLTLTCSNRVKDPDIEKYCNSDEFVDKIDLRKKPASITFKGGCQADLPCSFSR